MPQLNVAPVWVAKVKSSENREGWTVSGFWGFLFRTRPWEDLQPLSYPSWGSSAAAVPGVLLEPGDLGQVAPAL